MSSQFGVARALRAALSSLVTQRHRLLRLSFPDGDGPDAMLVAHRLDAYEALSRDFRFTVEVLSDDANIELKDLQGKRVTVSLVREDGSLRHFSGHVFEFRLVKTDGGFVTYEMLLLPWMAFLRLRRDNRLFHGQSLYGQTSILLREYVMAAWEFRVRGEDPVMTDACLFDETHHNYLHRRWEALGWIYWYEHTEKGHTLVLGDDSRNCPAIDGDPVVPYRAEAGSAEDDANACIVAVRRIVPSKVSLASFDFKSSRVQRVDVPTLNQQGDVPWLETYDYEGAYGFRTAGDGDALARRRMEEIEASGKQFEASGNDRYVMPGRCYRIEGHFDPGLDGCEMLVIEARHQASNNYLQSGAPAIYSNTHTIIRKKIPWRPGRGLQSVQPRIFGLQTAIVVGPEGADVHTDEFGRVRVQFHWDRIGQYDSRSSAWVRVSAAFAGVDFGEIALPRPGQEVIVQFLDGNPDRPLITGRLYNARNRPPAFSHSGSLPSNRALSGWRSREFQGRRYNQMRLDDTAGQISAQLASEHAASELNLGYLTQPRRNGHGEARGEGVELRTDAAAAIRAARGLLLSTDARPGGAGHQLAREELMACLDAARELVGALAGIARQAHADAADPQPQHGLQAAVDRLDAGSNTDRAKGRDGGKPVIALAGAAGIALSTPGSTTLYTGENLDLVSNRDLQQTVRKRWVSTAGTSISWFAAGQSLAAGQTVSVKLMAGLGNILAQAQAGQLQLQAEQDIVLGSNARVSLNARGGITLTEQGGAQIELEGGNVAIKCPGEFTVHAASFSFTGPGGGSPRLPQMPGRARVQDWLGLTYLDPETGEPIGGAPYEVHYANGVTVSGTLDASGRVRHDTVPDSPVKEVIYKPRPPKDELPHAVLEKLLG